ncbi:MAG: hypothetical protein FWF78_01355 [Defluviitaleaceae bacterium]|nr:hypothetical protein [Defluviitaleaceae bacterium]
MDGISVLFDLQSALTVSESVAFVSDAQNIKIKEIEDVKTLTVTKRQSDIDGFIVDITRLSEYAEGEILLGDRFTITGRFGRKTPIGGWCFELRARCKNGTNKAVHQFFPDRSRIFALSFVIDINDVESIYLITRTQVIGLTPKEFFVDGILITRVSGYAIADTRSVVYIMEDDRFLEDLTEGGYSEYLYATGDPLYLVYRSAEKAGRKALSISRRLNDWDGLDIRISLMNFLPQNKYAVRVVGCIPGEAPLDAEIMLQLIPTYESRSVKLMHENQNFVLLHAFTSEELKTTECVRIATSESGKNMSFIIYNIEVFVLE